MIKSAKAALPPFLMSLILAGLALPRTAHAEPHLRPDPAFAHPAIAHPAIPQTQPIWSDIPGAWHQTGIASWYGGKRWQGRRTASGTRYDDGQLTAAHATLPIGSRVRVIVPATGRSVVVTINDRPGTRRRIIDLSRAAAAKLGILSRGIAKVTLVPG
ncbi:MAG: hypothetical protein BGP12_08480 [Rhodospirillales bacterium 70-18]|nr:septal ring lytic transglycosylase RlpA family protein [Rhodospirillales bacterium]OJY73135.1 MAG: hypothetical protein BGP12_08480 [Rhodospirillales bacterium 70-18]